MLFLTMRSVPPFAEIQSREYSLCLGCLMLTNKVDLFRQGMTMEDIIKHFTGTSYT
jgi:hypothetical protein